MARKHGKGKKLPAKGAKRNARTNPVAPPISWDECDRLDVAWSFKQNGKISPIAKLLSNKERKGQDGVPVRVKVSRHRVVGLLYEAFRDGLISIPQFDPREVSKQLEERYERVKFQVLSSRFCFPQLAALQVLKWIEEECTDAKAGAYIAIGGGQTMANLIQEIPYVLREPENALLREWAATCPLTLINATAGGQPRNPLLEASFLTCRFAQAISDGCAGRARAEAVLHTVSTYMPKDEVELVRDAMAKTRVLVSGVGAPKSAYCIDAMQQKGLLSAEQRERLGGEILFHLYDRRGTAVQIPSKALGIKSNLKDIVPALKEKKGTAPTLDSPVLLATLFDFEALRGRPAAEGRSIIVVANCSDSNKDEKAISLHVLLQSGFLTHVCLSKDLADAVIFTARNFSLMNE